MKNLGSTVLTTAVSPAAINYALFGATLIGAFGIVDKNYYFEKTAPALIAGMDAARTQALLQIKQNKRPT